MHSFLQEVEKVINDAHFNEQSSLIFFKNLRGEEFKHCYNSSTRELELSFMAFRMMRRLESSNLLTTHSANGQCMDEKAGGLYVENFGRLVFCGMPPLVCEACLLIALERAMIIAPDYSREIINTSGNEIYFVLKEQIL